MLYVSGKHPARALQGPYNDGCYAWWQTQIRTCHTKVCIYGSLDLENFSYTSLSLLSTVTIQATFHPLSPSTHSIPIHSLLLAHCHSTLVSVLVFIVFTHFVSGAAVIYSLRLHDRECCQQLFVTSPLALFTLHCLKFTSTCICIDPVVGLSRLSNVKGGLYLEGELNDVAWLLTNGLKSLLYVRLLFHFAI